MGALSEGTETFKKTVKKVFFVHSCCLARLMFIFEFP